MPTSNTFGINGFSARPQNGRRTWYSIYMSEKKINGSEDEEIGGLHANIYAEANSSIGLVSEMAQRFYITSVRPALVVAEQVALC